MTSHYVCGAKSAIHAQVFRSEDIVIMRLKEMEIGNVRQPTGRRRDHKSVSRIKSKNDRGCNNCLYGGYIYLSDLLSNRILNRIGRIIAKAFEIKKIDAVPSSDQKGLSRVANVLNVPFVIVRQWFENLKGQPLMSAMFQWKWRSRPFQKRSLKAGLDCRWLPLKVAELTGSLLARFWISRAVFADMLQPTKLFEDTNPYCAWPTSM